MAEQFYYLVATLPELGFGERPPLTAAAFLDRCRGVVPAQALEVLEKVSLFREQPATGLEILDRWHARDHALRNALVRMRAQRMGTDPARHLRAETIDPEAARAARMAMETESPREADELLDRARWRWLNEFEALHFFDLERLVIHALKLQLLERRWQFNKEAGRKALSGYRAAAVEAGRQACAREKSSP